MEKDDSLLDDEPALDVTPPSDEVQVEFAPEPEPEPEPVEPEEPTEPEEEEVDDDLLDYSTKVARRIMRERRARRRAEDEAAEAAASDVAARTQLRAMQQTYVKMLDQGIADRIAAQTQVLKRAREDSNTDDEVKAQAQLAELQNQKAQVEELKRRAEEDAKQPIRNPMAEIWKKRNKWFGAAEASAETAAVRQIDHELAQSGYNPHTAEYFRELDRRILAKFPSLKQPQRPGPKRQPKSVVTQGGRPTGAPAPSGGKVVLTRADLENMRAFNLDPSNKAHLQEYAKQKRG